MLAAGCIRQATYPGSRRRTSVWLAVILTAVTGLLLVPGWASAATVTERPFLFSFSGAGTSAGTLQSGNSIAVDNSTGAVYVAEATGGSVDRFHPDGTAWPFSATASSSVTDHGSRLGVAVDNSGGTGQGRVLISDFGKDTLEALGPGGSRLWELPLEGSFYPTDVAVDATGHPWLLAPLGAGAGAGLRQYATDGTPPAQIHFVEAHEYNKLDLDAAGNEYLVRFGKVEKWSADAFSSILDPSGEDVYTDQTTTGGHIFTVSTGMNERQEFRTDAGAGQFRLSFNGEQTGDLPLGASAGEVRAKLEALPSIGGGNIFVCQAGPESEHRYCLVFEGKLGQTDVGQVNCEDGTTPLSGGSGCSVVTQTDGERASFQEFAADGTLLGSFGKDYVGAPAGIAYDPTLDRVYVLNGGLSPGIEVFGAAQTGTVPDVTIEAPTSIAVSGAHLTGVVNPQGTRSEWHFEWRKVGQSWGAASSSPPQSLPIDSNGHSVEYTTNALGGNTTYEVRLVGVNASNQLAGVSGVESFQTKAATESPTATIDAASAISTTAATITGSVNPRGDIASVRLQLSRAPHCSGGFEDKALQTITPAADSPVDIEFHLTGLLPTEHYCARLVATNSAGNGTSGATEFETQEAAPTQVFTAFVAPRTDTRARLNGYINPQGSEAAYRFEYSANGSTWTALPDQRSRRARTQIVVGEELTGLRPDTVYHYRFSAENGGGAGAPEGDEKSFRTRTSAEVQLPQRGDELVNQPNKGNQDVLPTVVFPNTSPVRDDGDAVLWKVIGGAPGGNTASEALFLAARTRSGWQSRPIIPEAEDQVGGGTLTYKLNESNAAFTRFLFHVARSAAFGQEGPPTFVTVDDEGRQQVLRSFPEEIGGFGAWLGTETTEDMTRAFQVSYSTDQLEELGAPGTLSLMPDGLASECGLDVNNGFTGEGDVAGRQWRRGYHRIDKVHGSRVYFQSVPNGAPCSSRMGIYTRDLSSGSTTEIDSGSAKPGPEMIRTTPDGGSLYFVTATSHSPTDENSHWDVYRWDAESGAYTCITCVVPDAQVVGSVLVSDDFSHIYFSSERQLIGGMGEPGEQNVYVLTDGELKFVMDLGGSEALGRNYSELSANGNVLLFRTTGTGYEELTADPMAGSGCEFVGEPGNLGFCRELYRYEASTESLECLSCRQDAPTDVMIGSEGAEAWYAGSADGRTVAFATKEPLLPEDVNNTVDIYVWHNGSIGLITDGKTQYPVNGGVIAPKVYGVDDSGDNIFFTVVDPSLTGYEQDGLVNLYDARVGGGFARPQPPVRCSGESCQGSPETAPAEVTAASSSIHRGNVPHRRVCPRGKARRRGRCVRRQHRSRRHQPSKRRARHGRGSNGTGM